MWGFEGSPEASARLRRALFALDEVMPTRVDPGTIDPWGIVFEARGEDEASWLSSIEQRVRFV